MVKATAFGIFSVIPVTSIQSLDIVIPAHNEAGSIQSVIRDILDACDNASIKARVIVAEDGSTDGTPERVKELSSELPVLLISAPERLGYSRAVIAGIRASTAPLVAFVDSDGQYDPDDLPRLVGALGDADVMVGIRARRADHWSRRLMSKAFKVVYQLLFAVPVRDPSCPLVVASQHALQTVSQGHLGILQQGFWWEFIARAHHAGLNIKEMSVRHLARRSGKTQVYRPSAIPRIAIRHLSGLVQLRGELAGRKPSHPPR